MVYAVLRGFARVALRWYYRDVSARGLHRVPHEGPLLLVVNHPNALVDVLVVGSVLRRRLMITAKSTLFVNPVAGWLLRSLGVLPLRRASDLAKVAPGTTTADPGRNEDTFRAVLEELGRGGAVLIFPEGKSHDDPQLAPLRTGAARIALQATTEGHAPGLAVVPVGLTFERKEEVRSRVHAEAGEPLLVRDWVAEHGAGAPALTAEIARRLEAVTLNYGDMAEALRAHDLSRFFAAVADEHRTVERVRPLHAEVSLARRMEESRTLLTGAPPALVARGGALLERVDVLDAELDARRLAPEDVEIETGGVPGARFALREGSLWLLGAPAVLWGRAHHWIPFRLAMRLAGTTSDGSRDQPAMRVIVGGLVIVLAWYVLLGTLAWWWLGPLPATLYLVSLPLSADLDLRLSERLRRMRRRVRAYLAFRRDPALQRRLAAELRWIREEALALEDALQRTARPGAGQRPESSAGRGGR